MAVSTSETYNYNYSNLISAVVNKIKSNYKNIDNLNAFKSSTFAELDSTNLSRSLTSTTGIGGDGAANSKYVLWGGMIKIGGHGSWHNWRGWHSTNWFNINKGWFDFGSNPSPNTHKGYDTQTYGKGGTLTSKHTITNVYNISAQSSSAITTYFNNNIPSVCGCKLSDTVTSKGLLSFLNFTLWVLKKSTTVIQEAGYSGGTSTDMPCFNLTSASYSGLKRGSDEKIYKSDFDSIASFLKSFSSSIEADSISLKQDFSSTSCSSCCSSSSCSSSCSSSSCSSSSSSSSCSSSSSAFIAYLNIGC